MAGLIMLQCNNSHTLADGADGAKRGNALKSPVLANGANGAKAYRHCPVFCPACSAPLCKCEMEGV